MPYFHPKRKERDLGSLLLSMAIVVFAYVFFAALARALLGAWGVLIVSVLALAWLVPPYVHRALRRRTSRLRKVLYDPRPERLPGRKSVDRVAVEVLASFILGATATVMLVIGYAVRFGSALTGYTDLALWVAGFVLTGVAWAVVRAWAWRQWIEYDPYDPDKFFPPPI